MFLFEKFQVWTANKKLPAKDNSKDYKTITLRL